MWKRGETGDAVSPRLLYGVFKLAPSGYRVTLSGGHFVWLNSQLRMPCSFFTVRFQVPWFSLNSLS